MKVGKSQEFLEQQYDKNKPRYVVPIINSILALSFVVATIYLSIVRDVEWWVVLAVILLMGLFVVSTWYNNTISKKTKRKMINHFQEETKLLIEEIKKQKNKQCFEVDNINQLGFNKVNTDEILTDQSSYDFNTKMFNNSHQRGLIIQLGITCSGLVVDVKSKKVVGIRGLSPCSVWIKKKLTLPVSTNGQVFVDFKEYQNLNEITLFKFYRKAETFYDPKSGLLVMGSHKINKIFDVIKISSSITIVLYEQELIGIWIQIQPNLDI